MTLSRETSTVLRGADLEALPLASLVGTTGSPTAVNSDGTASDASSATNGDMTAADESASENEANEQFLREAYETGFAEGITAAEAALRASVASAIDALDHAVGQHDAAREAWAEVVPAEALELALQLCELILRREVAASDDAGREAIVRCFGELEPGERAVVRLNPGDLESLGDIDDLMADRVVELIPDSSVAVGDAVADIAHGSVDARLHTALERVRQELSV